MFNVFYLTGLLNRICGCLVELSVAQCLCLIGIWHECGFIWGAYDAWYETVSWCMTTADEQASAGRETCEDSDAAVVG